MDIQNQKCVLVIDKNLPVGIIANTSAILGATLGKELPFAIGTDVKDKNNYTHAGIIKIPVPILSETGEVIKKLRNELFKSEYSDLTVVDFTSLAQECKNYNEFILKMNNCPEKSLSYMGIAVFGNKKKINKLTGSLPLLGSK